MNNEEISGYQDITGFAGIIQLQNTVIEINSATGFIIVPLEYPTISAAIAAAVVGDQILIELGTYNEDLTIPPGISLVGNGLPGLTQSVIGMIHLTGNITITASGYNI